MNTIVIVIFSEFYFVEVQLFYHAEIGLIQAPEQEDLWRISKFAILDSQSLLSFHCYSSGYLRSLASYVYLSRRSNKAFIATDGENFSFESLYWGVFTSCNL
jgi:hypothetical protein